MAITPARKELNKKYAWVVREGITKCLRKHGFERKGIYYWRYCDQTVAFAITVTRSGAQYDPNSVKFSIVTGMVTPAVAELYGHLTPDWMPNAYVAQLSMDLYQLAPGESSDFYLASHLTDDQLAAFAQRISKLLEEVVLPWYAPFKTAKDVGDFIMTPGPPPRLSWIEKGEVKQHPVSLRNAAIAYLGAGEFDLALALLDRAANAHDPHGKHGTIELREYTQRFIARKRQAIT